MPVGRGGLEIRLQLQPAAGPPAQCISYASPEGSLGVEWAHRRPLHFDELRKSQGQCALVKLAQYLEHASLQLMRLKTVTPEWEPLFGQEALGLGQTSCAGQQP